MSQRYPEDTNTTIDDFRRAGWKAAIESTDQKGYAKMSLSLAKAAGAALESGDAPQAKVLWLLADACSMKLRPASANEPFQPILMMMDGRRSPLPDDFGKSDVGLLAQIAEEVDHPWLRARLADLAWLLTRDYRYALWAVDAYRAIPLNKETWNQDGQECWERAVFLALSLGAAAGERIKEIEASVIAAFEAARKEDGLLAVGLSDLLFVQRLARERGLAIADKLRDLAQALDSEGDLYRARELFDGSARWFRRGGNQAAAAEMIVAVAEAWVKIAQRMSPQMAAAEFYEKAIQVYRTIPRNERARLRVEERIMETHRCLNEAGEKALGEMGTLSVPFLDGPKIAQGARDAVRGRPKTDALRALANVYSGFRIGQLREQAAESLNAHPLLALIPAVYISNDGRFTAKREGGFGGEQYQVAVWAQMMQNFDLQVQLVVRARILPALEVVALEHRLRESEFITLAKRSPIVPMNHAELFGKALFYGYERYFAEAIHLLVPQIEHMVRTHLKAAGVKTTTIYPDGTENENGLSSLMELPEVKEIFGEDVAFEIQALFCDPFGPNLRNRLAHGLLDDDQCNSIYSVYAWWLGLKLVFNTFWNSLRKTGAQGEPSEEQENHRGEELSETEAAD